MAERKRVNLLPFAGQKDQNATTQKRSDVTIRIHVRLPESNEDTCPIFEYRDELAKARKKLNNPEVKEPNGDQNGFQLDDMDDNDDDVRRIARQMEEKYGQPTNEKKRKKVRRDDYADIGMGYDESDSFIDNTDGYDEMVPHNVSTLHGGFYINSGALEFKVNEETNSDPSDDSENSTDSDQNDDDENVTVKRKRIIESSEDSDDESKTDKTINNGKIIKRLSTSKKQTKLLNGISKDDKEKKFIDLQMDGFVKKRKIDNRDSDGATSLENGSSDAKCKKIDLNQVEKKRKVQIVAPPPQTNLVKSLLSTECKDLDVTIPEAYKGETIEADDGKEVIKTSVNDIIESVIKGSIDKKKGDASQKGEEVKLPENLSNDIVNVIMAIKTCIGNNTNESKQLFTSEVNLLLLRLERKCKCLGKPSKLKVYGHLAPYLKIKSDELMKKAKQVVIEDERRQLNKLKNKLQLEINKTMPVLLESYEKSQTIVQLRLNEPNADDKSLRMPKRRFQWNDSSRQLVKDICQVKKRCLLMENVEKQLIELKIGQFLEREIQTLWPDGWMSSKPLIKIFLSLGEKIQPPTAPAANNNFKPDASAVVCDLTSKKPLPSSESECKLKVKPASELLKPSELAKPSLTNFNCNNKSNESVINLVGDDLPKVKQKTDYCHVIDLSDKADKVISETNCAKNNDYASKVDDIQKVMENLINLQNLSSPKKVLETIAAPTSSPVSVIVNKNYAHKAGKSRSEFGGSKKLNLTGGSYQEEFKKQLANALNHHSAPTTTNYTKSVDKFLSSNSNLVKTDDYYKNSNNNFTQSSNGHGPSTSQAGLYSILDDMYANFLTQYGYPKEASKSEPK